MKILCPVCKEVLLNDGTRYYCHNRHSFDISKEGYVNLNQKSSVNTGDEKEMIKARKLFLDKDHYKFLRDKLNELIDKYKIATLLDLGCGEGYYTQSFNVQEKIGLDLSKEALKIASKHDKTTDYILKTIFDIPLHDESVDVVTTIFAPVSSDIKRVLKNNGRFILVKPDKKHLFELKAAVYDKPYLNEIENTEIDGLKLVDEIKLNNKVLLNNEDLINLFKMTPYYHRTSKEDFEKLFKIENLEVSFDFIIDVFKKDV